MNSMDSVHKSVLLQETINGLNLKNQSKVIDGTFGGGGHSRLMCEKFDQIKIFALDQDSDAWQKAKSKFENFSCDIKFYNINFRDLNQVLKFENISQVDGVLLDLGLSSDQLDNSGRGFSFQRDEPLLMTMKKDPADYDLTAREILNTWSESSLADIIYGYGEEKYARKISKAIVIHRDVEPFETTFDLVKVIDEVMPSFYKRRRIHPATKTFQALRIAVNDELNTLEMGLENGFQVLGLNGRIAVITFHSLEDRIVKNFFRNKVSAGEGKLINKKPIIASSKELLENPRARSAKLRILEKIKN